MVKHLVRLLVAAFLSVVLISAAAADCPTMFFEVPAENAGAYKAAIPQDDDLLALAVVPAVKVGMADNGKAVVLVMITNSIIEDMIFQTGLDNPLTPEGRTIIKVSNAFIGWNRADVFERYPELSGQVQIGLTSDGQPIMQDKLLRTKWSCE